MPIILDGRIGSRPADRGPAEPASPLIVEVTAGEIICQGEAVRLSGPSTPKAFRAGAALLPLAGQFAIGLAASDAVLGAKLIVIQAGIGEAPVGVWDEAPVEADFGRRVYLSAAPGRLTLTVPLSAGAVSLRIGHLIGLTKVAVDLGEGTFG